ncbi:autoinducer binding domain-containing protein [Wenxinia saemankumensis]|uniref:Autoinducer binding domain-containing protein n=1 Tax=Wenxinia saemankumensis TaxID=1447782 RepID=A0A1M6EXL9_9RHOB|nr:autoinducer binding domain-containing protein [Wenxinia saemankumensis]SHI90188.1 Autoinducer binding domain-containing protein [Wenxinia saemankumensis]
MSTNDDVSDPRSEALLGPLRDLVRIAPAGFAIGLHVRFASVRFMLQSYPRAWIDEYSARGYGIHDPTVAWGMANTGRIAWADMAVTGDDAARVMDLAARAGLVHGLTVAHVASASRSVASFARSDRPFTGDEGARIEDLTGALHDATLDLERLPAGFRPRLVAMGISATTA